MSQVSMCASNAIYILKHCNTEWLLCTAFKDCWLVTIVERCHSMLLCSQWSSDPLCTYRFSTSSMCTNNVVDPVKCSAYERWCTGLDRRQNWRERLSGFQSMIEIQSGLSERSNFTQGEIFVLSLRKMNLACEWICRIIKCCCFKL